MTVEQPVEMQDVVKDVYGKEGSPLLPVKNFTGLPKVDTAVRAPEALYLQLIESAVQQAPMKLDAAAQKVRYKEYHDFAMAVIDRNTDVVEINKKDVIVGSGWRKIGNGLNVSFKLEEEKRELLPYPNSKGDGFVYKIGYRVRVLAVWPGMKRIVYGDGMCVMGEKGGKPSDEHSCAAIAHTRAQNRAIRNLAGINSTMEDETELDEVERQAA